MWPFVAALSTLCGLLVFSARWSSTGNFRNAFNTADVPVPPLMHTIWMSNPLQPYVLTALDSAVHYMPGMLIKLHIIVPDGATAEDIAGFRETFERQLEPLTSRPEAQIELVMHDDIPAELIGTPAEGLGITQAHMGGTMEILRANQVHQEGGPRDRGGSSHAGHYSLAHAADLMRLLLLWKEGGVYFDADVLFLRDIRPVIEESGPFSICQNCTDIIQKEAYMTSFLAVSTPGHPFVKMLLDDAHSLIAELGTDRIFSYSHELDKKKGNVKWTVLMEPFNNAWEKISAGDPLVDDLKGKRRGGLGMTYEVDGSTWTVFGLRYWSFETWHADTLRKPPTAKALRDRLRGYILHLWEMVQEPESNVRARYIDYIRKDTLMAVIHRIICLAYCDPDELERSANLG